MVRWVRSVPLCLLLVVASACMAPSQGPSQERSPDTSPTSSGSAEVAAPERPTVGLLRSRCGFAVPGRTFAIPGPDTGSTLVAAELGRGPAVGVLVHQVGATALCGWSPFAEWASRQGVRLLLVDACGYGESVCSEEVRHDPATWLRSTVAWARDHGARRVTLVGASMGGALVAGAGQRAGADAIIDLSGPVQWEGVEPLRRIAPRIRVPFLAAASDTDEDTSASALRRAAEAARGEPSRYYAAPGGHGWTMLTSGWTSGPQETEPTALARLVVRWIGGDLS